MFDVLSSGPPESTHMQKAMNAKLSRPSDMSKTLNNIPLSLPASLCRPLPLPVGLTWPLCVSGGPERRGEKGQENFCGSSHTSSQQQSNFNQFACPVHSHYALWHRKSNIYHFLLCAELQEKTHPGEVGQKEGITKLSLA